MANKLMNQAEMVSYLEIELRTRKEAYEKIEAAYDKAEHMDRVGMIWKHDKAQNGYYDLWNLCNDMGVIQPGHELW